MFIGFRMLERDDVDELLRVMESRAEYFGAAFGAFPKAVDIDAMFTALPDGVSPGQKRLLAITSDDAVVGVIDAVLDYPELGTVSVGTFLLDPDSPLRGMGMPVAALASERAVAEGMSTVTVGCPVGWRKGEELLSALGLAPVTAPDAIVNRVVHPSLAARAQQRWQGPLSGPPAMPG